MAETPKEVFDQRPDAADDLTKEPIVPIDFGLGTKEAGSITQLSKYVDDRLPTAKDKYDLTPAAGGDLDSEYYIFALRKDGVGGLSKVGIRGQDQLANIVSVGLNLGGNVESPSSFFMFLPAGTLNATIAPVTTPGMTPIKWMIKDVADVPPLIDDAGWSPGSVPSLYPVDTSFTAATLLPRSYRLYVADETNVLEITPAQTVTPTTTQTVPQTPNDVNFPTTDNQVADEVITSNTVKVLGLLAPTDITVSGGTYSKNGAEHTSAAGTIDNNDTITLQQASSSTAGGNSSMSVSLGLRVEQWQVNTAALGVTPGVISIVAATYSGAENGTITIDLARTGGSDGEVGCRVSTLHDDTYHTAEPGTNYVKITSEPVIFPNANTAQTVTITGINVPIAQDVVGELVIDLGSEFGGATIDSALNATLFTITATGASNAFPQDTGTDKLVVVRLRDTGVVKTSRSGESFVDIDANGGSVKSEPLYAMWLTYPGYSIDAPSVDFDIDFLATGIHYIWLEVAATSAADDSFWVGIDGIEDGIKFVINTKDGTYNYDNDPTRVHTINVASAGVHGFSIWKRERGSRVTRVLITTNAAYTPTGLEADAVYGAGSGGANPNNPTLPLGPDPVVDDKTPDPFPFPAAIDKLTGTTVESNEITVLGINVPTEIFIADDPTGTAKYSIDGGTPVATAGTVILGQKVKIQVTSSNSLGGVVTATLQIGTVQQTFSVTSKDTGFIVLPNPSGSPIIITTDNVTISGEDINPSTGPAIIIKNEADGTIIEGSRIFSPDDYGVQCEGNTGFVEMRYCELSSARQAFNAGLRPAGGYSIAGVSLHHNTVENARSGLGVSDNGGLGNISICDNWIKNLNRPLDSWGGVGVGLSWVYGPNIVIDNNIIINIPGESNPEDKIGIYKCRGTSASPILVTNNKIFGTGDSLSSSTINASDGGCKYVTVEDNIAVNSGQTGIGHADGDYLIFRRNKIFVEPLYQISNPSIGISNGNLVSGPNTDTGLAPVAFVYENNEVTFWSAANYAGRGNIEFLQPFGFGDWDFFSPMDIAGWGTNKFDTDAAQPAGLTAALWDEAWNVRPGRL